MSGTPLTLAQRVSLLNDVLDRGQIAAVLGLSLEEVADVALRGEQSTVSPAPRRIDLGTVNIVDLLNGPQTLYAPAGPLSVVRVAVDRASLVLPDEQLLAVVQGSPPFTSDPDTQLFYVTSTGSVSGPPSPAPGWVQDEPILAGITTEESGYFLDEALGPWQAGVTYGEAKECILESGHIWSSSTGTTGGSKPDFAGSAATRRSTVDDNTVTWFNEGAAPTTGSAHFYALVI